MPARGAAHCLYESGDPAMLNADENDLLCRVEGDAPMGRLMRAHWLPICMSEEVADADGTPVRARLLGQDLVVFRDSDGRLGILGEHCPHRRASLALGRNEESGLRCLYHGWKIDVDGNVVEMPSEPAASCLAAKVKHTAYRAEEAGGFVWAWMGDDEPPPFEVPAWAPTPATRIAIVKMRIHANWAQVLEGAIDSAHSSTLHATDMPPARVDSAKATATVWPRPSTDRAPRLFVHPTDFGFRYAAVRRPIKDAATHDYIRVTLFVAPFTVLIPPNNLYKLSILNVPLDDTHTMFYFIAWSDRAEGGIDQEAWRKFCGAQPGVDLDANWRHRRNHDNGYLQDRQAMKLGDFTGIRGIPTQDMAMWETMGAIADRTAERLGASDVAIVEFRRLMVDAVRRHIQGEPALGAYGRRPAYATLQSFEGIVAKGVDWKTLGSGSSAAPLTETA
jgi:phthalate 4,5-dioxygenase oxygenase subunit